ncbi:MAG TPA: fatty acid desaturase [Verrucomicrobiota bacterium]|nr:fatty acid desaturase [Verrucomicrobiota bacterium]
MATVTKFTADEQRHLDEQTTLPRMMSIPLAGLGLAVNGYLASQPDAWSGTTLWLMLGCVAFTTAMMFCWTSALHEAAHQTLFRSRALSIWTGRLLGTLMWTPYTAYREVHIRHHAYLNTPRDWELWPYSDPNASLGFRRLFVWFDVLCGLAAGPIIYGRIYFHRNSPIKSAEVRRLIRNEYWGIAAVWGAIWAYTTLSQQWPQHLFVVILPMYLAALMQTFRKFTEHLGMASFDPLLGTRTVLPRKWLLRLSSFLNFDIFIHGPHHRHPRLTHGKLESKLDEYRTANPETAYPAYERYWQAMLAMAPSMFLNPGCGVNAGAPAEDAAWASDVDNFVADGATLEEQG